MTSERTLQTIEVQDRGQTVHCIFCGQAIFGTGMSLMPCKHTLFVLTDESIEYRSSRVAHWLGSDGTEPENSLAGEGSVESILEDQEEDDEPSPQEMMDAVDIPGAFRLTIFQPMPSGFCAYYGFAPVDEDVNVGQPPS